MNNSVKFFMIIMSVFVVMGMSAQEMTTNIKFRQPRNVSVTNRYYAPHLSNGRSYDVVHTESTYGDGQMHKMSLSNNTGVGYYHSYGVGLATNHHVDYSAPTRIDYHRTTNSAMNSDNVPFTNDVVAIANPMRVGRNEEDLPGDPSMPIGSGVVPLLIFVLLWVFYKYRV